MGSVVIPDRGPTPYFHGRTEIIDTFNRYINHYKSKQKGGTTFLIQGAPGAGKTALLDVLSSRAEEKKWEVSKISIEDLYTPASMAQSLGRSYTVDHEQAAKIGVKFIEGEYVRSVAGHASPKEILKSLAPKEGLVLVLDEAQYLINLNETPSEKHVARDTLDVIHNGDVGRPVIFLTAGLGMTKSALISLGISRFMKDCTVGLGALEKGSERAVIQDWLIKEGGAKGDPALWIDAIAKECHGWPQHILSYMDPAVAYLESNNRRMTDDGLNSVLEKGNEFRINYYRQRAHEIDEEHRGALAAAVMNVPIGGTLTRTVIKDRLKLSGLIQEEADKLFKKALDQGIIDERDGRYGVPIPSMQTWLVEEYGKGRDQPPLMEAPEKTMGSKFSMER